MKLYTEEQVREAIRDAYWCCSKFEVECVFDKLTPIELPSYDEIWDKADEEEEIGKHYAFIRGAEWMRDKIQGSNNEN